ncbi:MAG: DNA-binding protein [Actinobacteria bacterium]|nr:DNA-binding protein [Actinomycetota bacterium]HRW02490.1 DNA-binding protein [Tetrasphaera sp.]
MPEIPFPRTGAPALRALEGAGYSHLQELDGIPMRSVLALPGMDPKERRDPLTPFAR